MQKPVILATWPGSAEAGPTEPRPTDQKAFVSECFVYGLMTGEAVEGREQHQVGIMLH